MMLFALLADIHGNYEALDAVLADIDRTRPDAIVCLGDVVGYGAEPGRCLATLQQRRIPVVAGNHDYAVAGVTSIEYFNAEAREGVLWTRSRLSDPERKWLADMPLTHEDGPLMAAHAAYRDPVAFDYILSLYDAALSFQHLPGEFGFTAHSHCPIIFLHTGEEIHAISDPAIEVPPDVRVIVNIGSVGQPRDGIPMAAYALFDTDKRLVEIKRTGYDVSAAAQKILDAGLPQINAHRLFVGR